ncbi:hypothetical protein MMC14_004295 [Varicellaria rhodocarpa]|nr:hypothetical protein [Varicellaria rhodocarpa]
MTLTAYENERLINIERNKALLEDLETESFASMFPHSKEPMKPRSKLPHPRKRKRSEIHIPLRSSARIAAVEKLASVEESSPHQDNNIKKTKNHNPSHRSVKQADKEGSPDLILRPQAPPDWSWNPVAPPPSRDVSTGNLDFPDFPDFTPNKTTFEVLHEGAFGGGYFRRVRSRTLGITITDDWRELPASWFENLSISRFLTHEPYDADVNKFKVSCGQSIETWEAAGWIDYQFDARGWFQWYIRFYKGRRCNDDQRQVGRWKKFVGPKGR